MTLSYRGKVRGAGGGAIYGARAVMAGEGEFEVTFRVKDCAELTDWTWLPRVHAARVTGLPPSPDVDDWSEKFKVTASSYHHQHHLAYLPRTHITQRARRIPVRKKTM